MPIVIISVGAGAGYGLFSTVAISQLGPSLRLQLVKGREGGGRGMGGRWGEE